MRFTKKFLMELIALGVTVVLTFVTFVVYLVIMINTPAHNLLTDMSLQGGVAGTIALWVALLVFVPMSLTAFFTTLATRNWLGFAYVALINVMAVFNTFSITMIYIFQTSYVNGFYEVLGLFNGLSAIASILSVLAFLVFFMIHSNEVGRIKDKVSAEKRKIREAKRQEKLALQDAEDKLVVDKIMAGKKKASKEEAPEAK